MKRKLLRTECAYYDERGLCGPRCMGGGGGGGKGGLPDPLGVHKKGRLPDPLGLFSSGGGDPGVSEADQARADEEERQRKIREATASVDAQFAGFDEPYFRNISDSYLAFAAPQLAEQAAKARHDLPYKFARTDNSDYQRVLAELTADQAREEANLKDKALDAGNEQRASVEKNRADLVQLANAGTDAGSVAQQSANRAAALSKPAAFSPIADLFSKYAQNFALANQTAGADGRSFVGRPLNFPSSRNAVTTVR